MTTPTPNPAPTAGAPDLDQRLQQAVAAALDTLVALASDRSDPGQARLAAAEILRFASRRKPDAPEPRRHEPALRSRTVANGLGAMLDLLTSVSPSPTPPLPTPPTLQHPDPVSAATPAAPAPPLPAHMPEPRAPDTSTLADSRGRK